MLKEKIRPIRENQLFLLKNQHLATTRKQRFSRRLHNATAIQATYILALDSWQYTI